GCIEEIPERIVHVLEPEHVGDALGRLEGEAEAVRSLGIPRGDGLGTRHPIEGVVDLHRREARRVVRQHLRGGELLGVETAPPLWVVIAGCPDPHRHGCLTAEGNAVSSSPEGRVAGTARLMASYLPRPFGWGTEKEGWWVVLVMTWRRAGPMRRY